MAPGQVLAFAADRRTGAPVSGADVRIWSDTKEQSKLRTDANGLAESSLPQGRYSDIRIVAVHGEDVAILTPYAWNLSSNPGDDITGYIYTDRPIYRPGHTVHFKVILRAHNGDTYQLPSGKPVQVEIQDPTGKSVLQTKLPLSQFGTIHGDFTLATNAASGLLLHLRHNERRQRALRQWRIPRRGIQEARIRSESDAVAVARAARR